MASTSPSKPNFTILVLPGDGIGPEVTTEATLILDQLSALPHGRATFTLLPRLWGGASIEMHGVPATTQVLEEGRTADAILMGATGGPQWDHLRHGTDGPEGGTTLLRKLTDVYANIRPCEAVPWHVSPLRDDVVQDARFVIVRENVGGPFYGTKVEEVDYASDLYAYRRDEVERITRMAGHLALAGSGSARPRVTSCDKANVLAASRLWRRVVSETITREFPGVELVHQMADSATVLMMKDPAAFNGVVLADNTFGDILSDLAAVIPGSLGVMPSACMAGIPARRWGDRVKGYYEPVHGSAPDIAGRGVANPVGAVLSVAMMLRYSFGMEEEAGCVEEAVRRTMEEGVKTKDLSGTASTREVGAKVRGHLRVLMEDLSLR